MRSCGPRGADAARCADLVTSRIAIGIRRAVAALQPHLVRSVPFRPIDEELGIERDTSRGPGVELDHPAVDPLRIELRIDRAVERVGEINAPAVATDLHHLWPAIELAVLRARVCRARHDPPNAHLSGELRVEWIRHVVLLQVAGAPARHVEEAVVHRQIYVGHERRNRFEALEYRRKVVGLCRLGRNRDDFLRRPLVAFAEPGPDRGGQILQADDAIDEAVGFGRVVRGPELEHELVFFAEIDLLQVRALGEIPEMQASAVFAAEQNFRNEAVLERVGGAPFAGDHRVVAEVPPGVITELLRSAVDLPAAEGLETLVIHDEYAARRLAILVSEGRDIDAARSAVDGMRPGIAGLVRKLRRLDDLDDFRRPRIGFGVENVDARGAQT